MSKRAAASADAEAQDPVVVALTAKKTTADVRQTQLVAEFTAALSRPPRLGRINTLVGELEQQMVGGLCDVTELYSVRETGCYWELDHEGLYGSQFMLSVSKRSPPTLHAFVAWHNAHVRRIQDLCEREGVHKTDSLLTLRLYMPVKDLAQAELFRFCEAWRKRHPGRLLNRAVAHLTEATDVPHRMRITIFIDASSAQ